MKIVPERMEKIEMSNVEKEIVAEIYAGSGGNDIKIQEELKQSEIEPRKSPDISNMDKEILEKFYA